MKQLLLVLSMFIGALGFSQSPASLISLTKKGDADSKSISAGNPWIVGSQLTFAFKDLDGGLKDNFIFSGLATTELASGDNWSLPLYGSFNPTSDDDLVSNSGFNASLAPYFTIIGNSQFKFIVHANLGYKLIPTGDSNTQALNQFRTLIGGEFHYYKSTESLPITLSVTPGWAVNNTIENKSFIEVDAIFPLDGGVGLLFNYVSDYKNDNIFRIGLITALTL